MCRGSIHIHIHIHTHIRNHILILILILNISYFKRYLEFLHGERNIVSDSTIVLLLPLI